jgi:uncharacterized membrane protein YbaN (DUF454 family)
MTGQRSRGLARAPKPLRPLLIAVGFLNVALGVLGIFVPLLPTTPFLLLAAACFVRSSDRFYEWLMTNRWVGDYLRSYMEHRATTMSTKVVCIATLWCCLGLAGVFFTDNLIVRLLLLAVAVGVTAHLASLKTIRRGDAGGVRNIDGEAESSPGGSSLGRASRFPG